MKTRKLYLWICNNLSLFFKIHLKCLRKILTFKNKLWNHIQTLMNFLHMSWNLLKVTYFSFSNFSVLISSKTEFVSEWESESSSLGESIKNCHKFKEDEKRKNRLRKRRKKRKRNVKERRERNVKEKAEKRAYILPLLTKGEIARASGK